MRGPIRRAAIVYLATAATFAVIDLGWLGVMVDRMYRPRLGDVLLDGVRLAPAVVFYLLYVLGIQIFAVRPAVAAGDVREALRKGALFGFFTYMTYDLTNYATLRTWSLVVTLLDIAWGTVLTALSASAGYLAARAVTLGRADLETPLE